MWKIVAHDVFELKNWFSEHNTPHDHCEMTLEESTLSVLRIVSVVCSPFPQFKAKTPGQ